MKYKKKGKSEAEKLKRELNKFFYDCESLRIELLSINISEDFKVHEKIPTITYQYNIEFRYSRKRRLFKKR